MALFVQELAWFLFVLLCSHALKLKNHRSAVLERNGTKVLYELIFNQTPKISRAVKDRATFKYLSSDCVFSSCSSHAGTWDAGPLVAIYIYIIPMHQRNAPGTRDLF